MGHQHYSTTQRYLHHKPRREDAAKIAEAFEPEPGSVKARGERASVTSESLTPGRRMDPSVRLP
jgi:hypothetical protein